MNDWEISERFTEIIKHFGRHIKHLTVKYVHITNIVRMLSFMPNLEKIFLHRISDSKYNTDSACDSNLKLNLNKLKEIKSSFCNEAVINIFQALPPGVLRKIDLTMHDLSNSSPQHVMKLFEFQQNIEEVETTERFAKLIEFEKMKLKKLKLWGENNLNRILNGQIRITKLDLSSIKAGELKIVYNELVSLQELKIGHAENLSSFELADLFRFKNLAKLSIEFDEDAQEQINASLSFAKSETLTELYLECLSSSVFVTESTLAHLGKNMPDLRILSLKSNSTLNSLNAIVRHMQNLEILHFTKSFLAPGEQFIFEEGPSNEKLQELCISGDFSDTIEELPKLIGCCKNLKMLSLTLGQPKIDFFELLKKHGTNLSRFECICSIGDDGVAFREMIHQKFKAQFSNRCFHDIYPNYGKISLVMSN